MPYVYEIKGRRGGKISLASVNKCCCRNSEIIPVTHWVATPAKSFFDGNVNAVPTAATFSHLSNSSVFALSSCTSDFFHHRVSGSAAIYRLKKKKFFALTDTCKYADINTMNHNYVHFEAVIILNISRFSFVYVFIVW